MKIEKNIKKIENLLFFFFVCQLFGYVFLLLTAKFLFFELPSKRAAELARDWPIIIACVVLVGIGRWGSVRYKKKLKELDDELNGGSK